MAGLNRVVMIGNLTDDPELRYTQNGTARTRFSIAINRSWRDREGNMKEEVTFVPVVVWGPQAEHCANFLSKGRPVAVDGRLRIDTFETQEGERKKVIEVVAEAVQFLGSGGGRSSEASSSEAATPPNTEKEPPAGDEEVPF
ncbi:single-stranded DNA-binding protein [Candidatus Acetothermia bacterium]|nr:single-stranded DNA-binding protein [Candidatus Acetothermia bacterium]MBI3459505.1 single-stranded DNA-binding protein [Candidatus Acetothermia bacterium]MBI3661343.1 single-stranded DNA-binding protein [Candidatus Acetothermia bacterium]